MRLTDLDMDVEAEKLIPKAKEEAVKLGHAVAIVRRGTAFFVWDSWQSLGDKPAAVLRLVSASGVVVKQ